MQEKESSLNKLVSLTFDESPKVRKEAAKSLGKLDDPAALFALVELSYDKDISVKNAALDILEQKKRSEKEVMSFAEMFSSGKNEEPEGKGEHAADTKEKVLQPITMLFEKRLGKEKADRVKEKMMPAIEKIYMKTVSGNKHAGDESDRKAMQEFLTSYLEAVSDIGEAGPQPPEGGEPAEGGDGGPGVREQLADELGEVGTKDKQLDIVGREILPSAVP